jgi:hypothetical protein
MDGHGAFIGLICRPVSACMNSWVNRVVMGLLSLLLVTGEAIEYFPKPTRFYFYFMGDLKQNRTLYVEFNASVK